MWRQSLLSADLSVPLCFLVDEVKQLLVVVVLLVPFVRLVVSEVVSKWNQDYGVFVGLRLLSVLVQQRFCPSKIKTVTFLLIQIQLFILFTQKKWWDFQDIKGKPKMDINPT